MNLSVCLDCVECVAPIQIACLWFLDVYLVSGGLERQKAVSRFLTKGVYQKCHLDNTFMIV